MKNAEEKTKKEEIGDADGMLADSDKLQKELKEQREQTSVLQKQLNEKLEDIDKLKVCEPTADIIICLPVLDMCYRSFKKDNANELPQLIWPTRESKNRPIAESQRGHQGRTPLQALSCVSKKKRSPHPHTTYFPLKIWS